jgi:hypothetical protein
MGLRFFGMDGLEDFFVKPVEGHPDLFAFRHDFMLEGKALDGASRQPSVTEQENGDLIIEGWAASFEGLDRQGENFVPGAFQRGIKSFLEGQSALCFHHKTDHGIGTVLTSKLEAEGLWMRRAWTSSLSPARCATSTTLSRRAPTRACRSAASSSAPWSTAAHDRGHGLH